MIVTQLSKAAAFADVFMLFHQPDFKTPGVVPIFLKLLTMKKGTNKFSGLVRLIPGPSMVL